jgi:hypothetical protein
MLLTHIFFVGRGGAARRVPAVFDPGKKKPRLMTRRGDKTVVLFSFFPKRMRLELELAPVIETKVQSVAVASSGQSLDHSL